MMKINEIVKALKSLSVETGSLACLGCGHEHNCSTSGCAIIRQAADMIESLQGELAASQRREKAAVEDMLKVGSGTAGLCTVCHDAQNDAAKCRIKNGGHCVFTWRGPEEEA